jgi:hypothetical protein
MSVRKLFFILLFITGCSVEKSGVNVGELYLKHGTLAAEPARE